MAADERPELDDLAGIDLSTPPPQIRLLPWCKWVTLAVLVTAVSVVLAGSTPWSDSGGETTRFTLGGMGLAVAILGAIWLARRFDETEKRIRERGGRRRQTSG